MDLDEEYDVGLYYVNHDYGTDGIRCKGWMVTFSPVGLVTSVIALMNDGEWRDMTDCYDSSGWKEALSGYATGNPPDE